VFRISHRKFGGKELRHLGFHVTTSIGEHGVVGVLGKFHGGTILS
jgi:hypothetical protein